MTEAMRDFTVGDIVAIKLNDSKRAVSCKVVSRDRKSSVGETKSGSQFLFSDDQVMWKLGHNGKWPAFVHRAFRGEELQGAEAN